MFQASRSTREFWLSACVTTRVVVAVAAVVIAAVSWLAFGAESWHAFVHWLPMFVERRRISIRSPLADDDHAGHGLPGRSYRKAACLPV